MGYKSDFWRLIEEEEKKRNKKLDNIKIISNGVESGNSDDRYTNSFSDDLSKKSEFWSLIAEEEKKRNGRLSNVRFEGEEEEEDIAPLPSSKEDDKESELEKVNRWIAEIEDELNYNDPLALQALKGLFGGGSTNFVTTLFDEAAHGTSRRSQLKDELKELRAKRDELEAQAKGEETKKSGADEGTWLKSGEFSDGYQFGDVVSSVAGTVGHAVGEVAKGVIGGLEGISDLILSGAGEVAELFGADGAGRYLKNEADLDTASFIVDSILGDGFEKSSFIGQKGEAVPQAVGQVVGLGWVGKLGAAAGLGKKGVDALVTAYNFLGSTGSSVSEARNHEKQYVTWAQETIKELDEMLGRGEITKEEYNQYKAEITATLESNSVSDREAWAYGVLNGTIQAGSEMLFGGLGKSINAIGLSRGISSLDDQFAKLVTKKISNYVVRNIAQGTIKAGAEGIEEVIAAHGSAVVKKLTYMSDEDLRKLVEDENALEQFIVGALASGISQTGSVTSSIKNKTDFITGLNASEEAVVNKEVENRIAEAEKDGKKLSNKDKNDIYERVMKDLDKGYISTDTIEEVLGGDSYKTYQDTVKSEDALKSEFDELDKVKANDATLGQSSRYNELKNKLEELKTTSERDFLQRKYKNEAYEIARGSRLEESYNERARRGQAFTADLSKYDEKQRTVVQRAIDSGILNNTNRTHEFVDIIARLSADKDVPFDFTNNAKLKESGFAIDGVTVNGYVTKDGITINMDSPKAWQSTVGHEITHVLEGTELYTELQNAIVSYAKTKGDYQSRLDALTKVYEGVEDADINAELTADLVGDYLFQDEDFVNHLSANHRNVFQKIYDEIKYLVKVTTAGTKEARELEKVKHAFEKAFRAETKKTTGQTRFSVSYDGKVTEITDSEGSSLKEQLKENLDKVNELSPVDNITYNPMNKKELKELALSEFKKTGYVIERQGFGKIEIGEKQISNSLNYLNNEAEKAALLSVPKVLKRGIEIGGHDNHKGRDYSTVTIAAPIEINGQVGDVVVAVRKTGKNRYYAHRVLLPDGTEFVFEKNKNAELTSVGIPVASDRPGPTIGSASDNSISQTGKIVNRKFSLSSDSEGTALSDGQKEFFKDSKAVDRDGNLLKVYHTTKNDFTVFDDSKKGSTTEGYNTYLGHFFTDDPDYMSEFPDFKGGKTDAYYLNMTNPIDMNNISREAFLDIVEVTGGDVTGAAEIYDRMYEEEVARAKFRNGTPALELSNLLEELTGEYFFDTEFHNALRPNYDKLIAKGYDGVINNMDGAGWANEYVVLNSNQAKLTTNKNPTSDPDVRYSLSEDAETDSYSRIYDMQVEVNRLTQSIQEFEKTADFKTAMDNLSKAIDSGDIDNGVKAYQQWRVDSGYDAMVSRRDSLRVELENLRKEFNEEVVNKAVEQEKTAIAKSGLSETEYFRKQAVKEFGYTPYFYDAGYITPNGKMLNFSGEKGKHYGTRGQDHRAIGTIYAETEGTAALNRFVRDGNIRIMAESPGLDMSTIAEPTKEQYATIRKFASEYADKEYFSVDFTDESGKVIGSLTYENRINPTRIVNDIKHYYETGEIRQPSGLDRFRYSLSKDTEGRELSSEQQDFFALAQTRDENGVLKPFYHGTRRADRVGTVFDPSRATSGPMAYFTDNRTIADHYARDKADTSLAYDSDYDSYETQFRVNRNGKDMSVVDLWYTLPMSERNAIKEKAKHITMDDDWDKVIYSEETQHGLGNFDAYELNRHRGNALHTLVDSWLTDGNIFGEEHKFLDVLKLVGIEDATYKDPDFRDEKTYEVYLNITNPFDTSNISEEMVGAFRQAAEEADFAPGNSADMWDKHNVDPDLWMERLEDDIKNGTTNVWTSIPDFVTDVLKAHGYDGIFDTGGKFGGEGHTVAIPFYSEQIKSVDNRTPTSNVDINLSLSENSGTQKTYGNFATPARDLRLETAQEDIAPVAGNVQETLPDDYAPMTEDEATMVENEALNGLTDEDAPPEYETPYYNVQRDAVTVDNKSLKEITKRTSEFLGLGRADQKILEGIIQNYSQNENLTRDDLYSELKKNFSVLEDYTTNDEVVQLKKQLKNMRLYVSDEVKLDFGGGVDGYSRFLRSNFGKLKIVKDRASGVPVDSAYMELSDLYPSYFPEDIINPADQLRKISEMASMSAEEYYPMELSDAEIEAVTDMVYTDISDYMNEMRLTSATEASHAPISDSDAPMVEIKTEPENKVLSVKELYEQKKNNYRNTLAAYEVGKEKALANFSEAIGKKLDEYNGLRNKNTKKAHTLLQQIENLRLRRDNVQVDYANRIAKQQARLEAFESKDYSEFENKELAFRRKDLHKQIVDKTKAQFEAQGYDLDEVLRSAKDLSTIATVDNTPQRVMEKSLGYKEGQILSDITVNKVAQNETEAIKWLNSFTNKKDGLLAKISKQYNIKPGSKESAAAQMYAEGFYVDKENNVIQYGDTELAKDFPDAKVRENIKGLAKDERIRQIYDETLAKINESRARNAYPEIPKLDNYFLHFRAMDDTFSRLGLPFNPKDIKAKDLPTDLNGVTADLKPGQPYFSSAMHRRGQRTSFDLLGGLEKYLSSAKNQIYHIDDIQTLRALRNYIADSYGQANGLEGLDALDEDVAQEKIKQVYGAHLSTFAKFLNEEANVIAGKTALIDRGLEGIVGRRAMTFMDTVNRQVGSNMVGYNVSSALTNLIAPVQAFAKTNKFDFIKGFAQTVSNKVNGIKGKSDGFAEASPVMIRRNGEERFHRTAWQKLSDPGYALMGAVDNFSTEIIARAKYNELTRKGMDSETAHVETDKWVSRLMGDRSLGQQPQLYNSKVLGLVTKFQLEVRNQLDSQFYDTIKEAETSTEDIQNGLERNAKKAAKIASTFFTLAVGQHVFGKVFESIAGYNPAFDIISVIAKAFGWDDDEEDEDTVLDNIEQAFFELMGDMPYTSILEGGRIPISSALPIEQLYKGTDQYGNEKSRLETIKETLPYYLMPGGYGQLKKTTQGLEMFNDEHPISGSYTDSGKLRFPVEDTLEEMFRAGLFGQYASSNARDYFDNERDALDEKKTQEFIDSGISIQDYWDYREGLKGLTTINEKADYIYGLDLPIDVKNLLINNLTDREEDIDLSGMEGFEDFEEFDFAVKNPEKYEWLTENGITVAEYEAMDKDTKEEYNYAFRNPEKYEFLKEIGVSYSDFAASDDVTKEGYDWAFKNPDKYKMSQAITEDFGEFYSYKKAMNEFDAKDENGETVSGLKKQRVADYISSLDIEYGRKLLLFKSQYPSDDSYNKEIVEYLDSRSDISYEDMVTILSSLGFRVNGNTVSWD